MGQLLEVHEEFRGKVVLVQILNPVRSRGKDIKDVQNKTNSIANEINKKYGELGYQPIVLVNGPVSTQEKASYYAISECCVVNATRDGMNLMPYRYTVCRQGIDCNDSTIPKRSVIIVSEFIGCSPSLSGAIRVKPQGVSKGIVAENLISTMPSKGKAPYFLLCIRDDRSDEDMFESIARSASDPSYQP